LQNILSKLTSDLSTRISTLRADRNIYTYILKDDEPSELISNSYIHILNGLEKKSGLVEVAASIGRKIRQKKRLGLDSIADVQVGWFICISYIECGILNYRLKHTYKKGKKSKHQSYHFSIKDWDAIKTLWTLIDKTKIDLYPLKSRGDHWDGPIHSTGLPLIKKSFSGNFKTINTTDQAPIFNALNALQNVGWLINKDVFIVYQQALKSNIGDITPFKLHKEIDEQKKKSLLIEAEAIEQAALSNLNNAFYHLYNCDFRGRIYVNTAFLNEQSSDNAKGLLLLEDPVKLGEDGWYWLRVHISNCYGNDKVSLDDRAKFVSDSLQTFIGYANSPFVNTDWMNAEKPFSFLACCFELKKIGEWLTKGNFISDYECHLPVYIDGSNNGVQHLVAMSQDEIIAPLVNLVPQELPGDVYMYIAKYVWEELKVMTNRLSDSEKKQFNSVFETAKNLQSAYMNAPDKSEAKALAYQVAQQWRNEHRVIREKLFPLYWLAIDDPKDQRKVVKRNVMTLGYGGTSYGMGQQIIDDTRDMSEYLRDKEHLWGALLGNLVFETCYSKLPGPAKMLRLFQSLADRSNEQDRFLAWKTPITNFPVFQTYTKPKTARTKLKYGNDELKVHVQTWESTIIDKDSQKTGAAPNIVHSFDAAHLTMVVASAHFPVTVVHDSFGCHPGNMSQLFKLVREKFIEFYDSKPLNQILAQLDSEDLMPELGTLDYKEVLKSQYAFC